MSIQHVVSDTMVKHRNQEGGNNPMGTKGETKAETVEGQADITPEVTTPELEPELVVEPEPAKGKGETKVENWEQKYKTLEGMHRQTTDEMKSLKQERLNYSEINSAINQVSQTVSQQGETLSLITDILSENAVDNEDLSSRVKQAKQKQEDDRKRIDRVRAIGQDMGTLVQVAEKVAGRAINLPPNDEALKPAWEAANKGDRASAIQLTTLAIETKVSAMRIAKPGETDTDKVKKKVPVITTTTGHVQDWKDLSPTEKIKRGIQAHHDNE